MFMIIVKVEIPSVQKAYFKVQVNMAIMNPYTNNFPKKFISIVVNATPSTSGIRDHIHHTSLSSELRGRGWKGMSGTNTLAYWVYLSGSIYY